MEAATGAWHVTIGLLNAPRRTLAADVSAADQSRPAASLPSVRRQSPCRRGEMAARTQLSSLSIEGTVNGRLPDPAASPNGPRRGAMAAGPLEITRLTIGWGPLGLTAAATLALDDQFQPMGSGNGRFVGYGEALDKMSATGMLTKSAATAAKAVLSLMAGTSDTDQPPRSRCRLHCNTAHFRSAGAAAAAAGGRLAGTIVLWGDYAKRIPEHSN